VIWLWYGFWVGLLAGCLVVIAAWLEAARPACTCRRGTLARMAEPGRAGGSRQPWSRLGPRTGRAGRG
jgi:hypothetical protein